MSVLFVVFLVKLASSGSVKSQLGTATYIAGYAHDYAPSIADKGPLLLPDLIGKNRPVFLQHVGPDVKKGWVAVQATVPGDPPRCVLQWHQDDHRFHDLCSGATYPEDGAGLVRFKTTVLPSDRIEIDLRAPLP